MGGLAPFQTQNSCLSWEGELYEKSAITEQVQGEIVHDYSKSEADAGVWRWQYLSCILKTG